jgi:hypothetical protein
MEAHSGFPNKPPGELSPRGARGRPDVDLPCAQMDPSPHACLWLVRGSWHPESHEQRPSLEVGPATERSCTLGPMPTLQSNLSPVGARRDSDERPPAVSRALVLLYVTIVVGILRSAMEDTRLAGAYGVGFLVFVQLFVFAVLCLLCFFIANRRNWARIVYLVLTVIGTPLSVKPLLESFAATPISGFLGVIQAAVGIVAAVLLFRREAASWFRRIPV